MLVGMENFAHITGGVVTIFNNFKEMLERNGFSVIPEYLSSPEQINASVREKKPDLMVFFFPELLRRAHLSKEFNSIPRILMFHSRPDFYFAMAHGLERRLKHYYINTHAQILMESYRSLLPKYIREGSVSVIPNGVIIPPEKAVPGKRHKKAVYFSRIDPGKGVDLLIEAFDIVSKKYPDWKIDIFGSANDESYLKAIKEMISRHGLEDRLILKGVAKGSTSETLAAYDFCVFPSRFEGFSIGLAEAMAVGLPSVGLRNCSGVNEIIVHERNGYLCEDTPEGLAAAIIRMIENPVEELERLGEAARKTIEEYSPESVEKKWLELIDSILNPAASYPLLPVKELVKIYKSPNLEHK